MERTRHGSERGRASGQDIALKAVYQARRRDVQRRGTAPSGGVLRVAGALAQGRGPARRAGHVGQRR